MNKEQLKSTIQGLHEHLESAENVDPELRDMLVTLDGDIHHLMTAESAPQAEHARGVMDRAESLAARFAADHPHAEALLREIVAALAKMGV